MQNNGLIMGAMVGVRTGIVLSVGYSFIWLFLFLIWPLAFLFGAIIALIIGVIPSLLLGLITGSLIGGIIGRYRQTLSSFSAICVGVSFTLIIVAFVNVFLGAMIVNRPGSFYVPFVGLPSVIYVGAGGWAGKLILETLNTPSIKGEKALPLIRMRFFISAVSNVFIVTGVFLLITWLTLPDNSIISWALIFILFGIALFFTKRKVQRDNAPVS